jgi:L-serine dehydratase
MYMSIKEIVDAANERQVPIYTLAIEQEMEVMRSTFDEAWQKMEKKLRNDGKCCK